MFSKFGKDRWALIHFCFLLMLLLLATAYSGSNHDVRVRLQNDVFDFFNKTHPREASDEITIIDIDEKSLEELGQWPWPRNIMATLVNNLTELGAKVIVFDGVMAEPDRSSPKYFLEHLPEDDISRNFFDEELGKREQDFGDDTTNLFDHDAMLAAAIKQSKIFVTGFTYGTRSRTVKNPINKNRFMFAGKGLKETFLEKTEKFDVAVTNLPMFSKNAAGNGSFMAKPDQDGILRKTAMIFTDGKNLYPSLSLATVRVAKLGRKGMVRVVEVPLEKRNDIDTAYRITVANHAIPIDQDGLLHVYYRRFCTEKEYSVNPANCARQDYVSAFKVISEDFHDDIRERIKDKIIIIGTSAEGLKDLRSTALQPLRPGVEVHANVTEQILQDKYLYRTNMTRAAEAVFIFASGLFFIVVSPFIGILVSLALCMTIIGVAIFGAYFQYVEHGYLIDPIYPSISVFLIFVASTILSYVRAEAMRKQIRAAFGMYVSPEVMKDLEKNPKKLKLGGENREISVMFTDIRKFTKISESLAPEDLINLMNEFLTSMTDIVLNHKGTVDKYIGDAMMTFWNAPRDVENHEQLACRAALKMQKALEPVNEKVKQQAIEEGREPILLQAGIGISTGMCAVGNMGSVQRFAYSALGDAVNLSSRLEGMTKFYGVSILISEDTCSKLGEFAAIELDMLRAVGKAQAVRVYALFGDEEYAKRSDFAQWQSEHNMMLEAYRNRDFDKALKLLEACKQLSAGKLDKYYANYTDRITALKVRELPADWDAVFIAETK